MNIKTGNQNKKTKVFTKEEVNTQLTKEDSTRLLELKPRFVGNDASDEHFWNFSKFKIDDSDVSEYFKDYLNSKGFQRIINNQNNWWYKRHPFRKWYSNPDRGTKNWFQIAAQKEPRIIITDNYPEISFTHTYPGSNSVVIVGNRESEEFPFKFTLAHEYTHANSPRNWFAEPQNFDPKSAQYEVLKQNINTEQNKHDELQYEKHADIWGLKYLLYKEGIYDSRSNKDITEKEVQQLREKYPKLRPLKQMNNKEVVFQLNHVAVNDQNTNRKPLYARKGQRLIHKAQKGKDLVKLKKLDVAGLKKDPEYKANFNWYMNPTNLNILQDSLIARGAGFPQRVAVLSQVIPESGGDTKPHGNGAYGYVGWRGNRAKKLPNTPEGQAHVLMVDLFEDPSDWNHGGTGTNVNSGKEMQQLFVTTPNTVQATKAFMKGYVRPPQEDRNKRIQFVELLKRYMK